MTQKDLRKLKIIHTEASCGWGGQEIRILEEARGLIGRGHQVSLICPLESRIYTEASRYSVPVTALPIGRKRLAGVLTLRQWIKEQRPDIVNTHSSTDSWLTGLACLALSKPPAIVRTRHISASIAVNAASKWLYGRSAQHVVTTGESLRQTLINELGLRPERVTSIPTGIDTERFSPGDKVSARTTLGLEPNCHYLGIVATLRSWKGHLYLLDAFAKLGLPDWKLLFVGEGPMRGNIDNKITALGLENRVIFAGQRSDPEAWLRALDIFCLPSYANEGVPQSIMQAMLSELPIITTPVGAILETVTDGETALVVEPRNAESLAEAILRLIDNAPLARRLADSARETAQARFSLENMLNRMEALFMAVSK